MLRRIAASALLAALAAGPASAQLPAPPSLPILPRPGQPPPPSRPPPPPPARDPGPGTAPSPRDSVAYGTNPARTGQAPEEAVWGPLRRAWAKPFPGDVSQPLIVGGRAFVEVLDSGARIVALDLRDGRQLWERAVPGGVGGPLGADGGIVASVNRDGVVRAFALADGRPLWEAKVPGSFPFSPLVMGGRVFVWTDPGSTSPLHALSARDGSTLWSRDLGFDSPGRLAADAERIFAASSCGRAVALVPATGAVAWSRPGDGGTCHGSDVAVVEGRVHVAGPGGRVLRADTGADAGSLGWRFPQASAAGLGYAGDDPTEAFDLTTGAVRWAVRRFAGVHPLAVGTTLYVTDEGQKELWGLDLRTGHLLSGTPLPATLGLGGTGGGRPGKAAGYGRLLLAEGATVVAYESVLAPRPGGLDFGADAFDVVAPKRVGFVGGLHPGLRGRASGIDLQVDPHPYGRFRRAARGRVAPDGTTYFRARISRNTRVRVRAVGLSARSPVATVVAWPRFRVGFRLVSRTRAVARVRLSGGPGFRMGGRRVVLYLDRRRARRYVRLGTGRLRQAGRVAVADIPHAIPRRIGARDGTTYCVPGMPRLGYGVADRFQRSCGRRSIRH